MKSPAELAARLRKMVLAAQHHYSPSGQPLRSIVVSPEWLEDMADAANALHRQIEEIECTCAAKDMAFGRCCKLDDSLTERELQTLRNEGGLQEMAADEIESLRCMTTRMRDSADPSSHG